MSRFIRADVPVMLRPSQNAPAAFQWEGRCYQVVQVEAVWKERGCWWDGEGEQTCFRVTATTDAQTGCFDLCFDHEAGGWILRRVLD